MEEDEGDRPAIITSHSTSNSGSSRGFLRKRLTSPIMGNALIPSFVSSASGGGGSSGRARTMKVSSSKINQKDEKRLGGERWPRTVLILLPTSYLPP